MLESTAALSRRFSKERGRVDEVLPNSSVQWPPRPSQNRTSGFPNIRLFSFRSGSSVQWPPRPSQNRTSGFPNIRLFSFRSGSAVTSRAAPAAVTSGRGSTGE